MISTGWVELCSQIAFMLNLHPMITRSKSNTSKRKRLTNSEHHTNKRKRSPNSEHHANKRKRLTNSEHHTNKRKRSANRESNTNKLTVFSRTVTSPKYTNHILQLCDDASRHIFDYLTPDSNIHCSLTCRHIYGLRPHARHIMSQLENKLGIANIANKELEDVIRDIYVCRSGFRIFIRHMKENLDHLSGRKYAFAHRFQPRYDRIGIDFDKQYSFIQRFLIDTSTLWQDFNALQTVLVNQHTRCMNDVSLIKAGIIISPTHPHCEVDRMGRTKKVNRLIRSRPYVNALVDF